MGAFGPRFHQSREATPDEPWASGGAAPCLDPHLHFFFYRGLVGHGGFTTFQVEQAPYRGLPRPFLSRCVSPQTKREGKRELSR